jgi:hypothetical protein
VRPSLLEAVRGLLERTYRLRTGLNDLAPFVIGDRGFRLLYERRPPSHGVGAALDGEARTLVRETDQGVAACIYFPDALIAQLEAYPPQRGVGDENLEAFAVFVEEIDHLLLIAERSLGRRPVSLFELELHADVSKYLVLARFLAGASGHLGAARRTWLRHRLFDPERDSDGDPAALRRYRDAARWAVRLLDGLGRLGAAERVAALRRFHAADLPAKLGLIERGLAL